MRAPMSHRVTRSAAAPLFVLALALGQAGVADAVHAQGREEAATAGADQDEHPTSSLTYERQRGAEQCPDEAELRERAWHAADYFQGAIDE